MILKEEQFFSDQISSDFCFSFFGRLSIITKAVANPIRIHIIQIKRLAGLPMGALSIFLLFGKC
jgi:hypothetical protein